MTRRHFRSRRLSQCMRSRRKPVGAATLETAIALSLFVTLILGMVDLGYGVFKYHVLSQSTRQIARQAIVRGQLADRLGTWGPEPIVTRADQSNEITEAASSGLVGWDKSKVNIRVDWIDGGNDARQGHRVRVQLDGPYHPMMTFIFGNPEITLRTSSTMLISH